MNALTSVSRLEVYRTNSELPLVFHCCADERINHDHTQHWADA
jgi:hypothetical protein